MTAEILTIIGTGVGLGSALATTRRWRDQLVRVAWGNSVNRRVGRPFLPISVCASASFQPILPTSRAFLARPMT